MSIFGPTDTRNYKKIGKELYNTEIRFANTFCEMYGFTHNQSKFAVMDQAKPFGALIYLYGVLLINETLEDHNSHYEQSTMLSILAKVHKKPVSALTTVINGEYTPDEMKEASLTEIQNAIFEYGPGPNANLFEQYFNEVEALVRKWERDEF